MAVSTSHTITIRNKISEKEGIQYILYNYIEMYKTDAKVRKKFNKI